MYTYSSTGSLLKKISKTNLKSHCFDKYFPVPVRITLSKSGSYDHFGDFRNASNALLLSAYVALFIIVPFWTTAMTFSGSSSGVSVCCEVPSGVDAALLSLSSTTAAFSSLPPILPETRYIELFENRNVRESGVLSSFKIPVALTSVPLTLYEILHCKSESVSEKSCSNVFELFGARDLEIFSISDCNSSCEFNCPYLLYKYLR